MQSRVESIPFGGDYQYVLQTLHGLCSDNGIQWLMEPLDIMIPPY